MRKEIYHQYAHSEKLVKFIDSLEDMITPRNDLQGFYDYIYDINKAIGFGLDIWGNFLGIKRSLSLLIDDEQQQYTMNDEQYRLILKLKCTKNISDATCDEIYKALSTVFAEYGNIYLTDLGEMHLRYSFEFLLDDILYAILSQTKVIPRPAGVNIEIYELPSRKIFGFNGQELENFNNGTFFQGRRK